MSKVHLTNEFQKSQCSEFDQLLLANADYVRGIDEPICITLNLKTKIISFAGNLNKAACKNVLLMAVIMMASGNPAFAQSKLIDMHVHSYTEKDFGSREPSTDYWGQKGSTNASSH